MTICAKGRARPRAIRPLRWLRAACSAGVALQALLNGASELPLLLRTTRPVAAAMVVRSQCSVALSVGITRGRPLVAPPLLTAWGVRRLVGGGAEQRRQLAAEQQESQQQLALRQVAAGGCDCYGLGRSAATSRRRVPLLSSVLRHRRWCSATLSAGCRRQLSGGARDVTHDTIGRVITDDIRRVIGSNMQLEPRHIFTNTLPPRASSSEHDPNRPARRVRSGI